MRHPLPPSDLNSRGLPLVASSGPFLRMHDATKGALYFGRTGRYRFDAPAGQYGVLYCGDDPHCAFIETFGHDTGINVVSLSDLRARSLARIELQRPLSLVDLTGAGLARIGADNQLCDGDYTIAQQWALALHNHPDQPDGISFRSRHDPSRLCAAIFDRAKDALTATSLGSLADSANADLLGNILDTYGFGLVGT